MTEAIRASFISSFETDLAFSLVTLFYFTALSILSLPSILHDLLSQHILLLDVLSLFTESPGLVTVV